MSKPKGEQVPLVMVREGQRFELGKAIVYKDGSFEGQISTDAWSDLKSFFVAGVGEFCIIPAAPKQKSTVEPLTQPLARVHIPGVDGRSRFDKKLQDRVTRANAEASTAVHEAIILAQKQDPK